MRGNGLHLLQCVSSAGRTPAQPEKLCVSPEETKHSVCLCLCIVYELESERVVVEFSALLSKGPGDHTTRRFSSALLLSFMSTLFSLWVSAGAQKGEEPGSIPKLFPLPHKCLWKNVPLYMPGEKINK